MRPRKVLSMWQPWASFVVPPRNKPVKEWETRAFAPRMRTPIDVAIHATLRRTDLDYMDAHPDQCRDYFVATIRAGIERFPLGKIIGVATIIEVAPTDLVTHQDRIPGDLELKLGDYTPGRYAWRFAFAQPLPEPIPFKGRQSVLWDLPSDINEQIEAQLQAQRDRIFGQRLPDLSHITRA
jgi:activating signal cointegrator 1